MTTYTFQPFRYGYDTSWNGISNNGFIAATYWDYGGTPRYGAITSLNDFNANVPYKKIFDAGGQDTWLTGIADAGSGVYAVGYYYNQSGQQHSFVFNGDSNLNGSSTTIDLPGLGVVTTVEGVNDLEHFVGSYRDVGGAVHGYIQTGVNGGFTTLDDPSSHGGTSVNGINHFDQLVGNYLDSSGNSHGFLYENGTYVDLDVPGAYRSSATGINDWGEITGWYSPIGSRAAIVFLYSPGSGYTDIGGGNAFGLNNAGVIVGSTVIGGHVEGFLAAPYPPAPNNHGPVITSDQGGETATIALAENTTAVTTVTATDPDAGQTLSYSIIGGADAGKFTIGSSTRGTIVCQCTEL